MAAPVSTENDDGPESLLKLLFIDIKTIFPDINIFLKENLSFEIN